MKYTITGIKNNGHIGPQYEVECVRPESTAEYRRLKKKVDQGELLRIQLNSPERISQDTFARMCSSRGINPGIAIENKAVVTALKERSKEALRDALNTQF